MHAQLIIYTDQLKKNYPDSLEESILLKVEPDFLDISEKNLSFESAVNIRGKAYVTNEYLLITLSISTEVKLPCIICNEPFFYPIEVKRFHQSVALENLPSSIYDYSSLVREEILLNLPPFAECHAGRCPERQHLTSYLKNSAIKQNPFADL
jgi:uncharacterized metal-binding protein YceD (DUF177 family)